MILAATIAPRVAHSLTYLLVTWAVVTFLVAASALVVLLFIYWALNIWEKWRIIAHYRREEKRDASTHQPKPKEGK